VKGGIRRDGRGRHDVGYESLIDLMRIERFLLFLFVLFFLDVTVVEYDDGDNDYDEREGRGK
jgi:hypothetical protein